MMQTEIETQRPGPVFPRFKAYFLVPLLMLIFAYGVAIANEYAYYANPVNDPNWDAPTKGLAIAILGFPLIYGFAALVNFPLILLLKRRVNKLILTLVYIVSGSSIVVSLTLAIIIPGPFLPAAFTSLIMSFVVAIPWALLVWAILRKFARLKTNEALPAGTPQ